VVHKADSTHSAKLAFGVVYIISDAIGRKIEGIGSSPVFAWAGAAPDGSSEYQSASLPVRALLQATSW
jgi:hypothetical protein